MYKFSTINDSSLKKSSFPPETSRSPSPFIPQRNLPTSSSFNHIFWSIWWYHDRYHAGERTEVETRLFFPEGDHAAKNRRKNIAVSGNGEKFLPLPRQFLSGTWTTGLLVDRPHSARGLCYTRHIDFQSWKRNTSDVKKLKMDFWRDLRTA